MRLFKRCDKEEGRRLSLPLSVGDQANLSPFKYKTI